MNKTGKYAGAAMTALLGLGAYAFFALRYPYHLHFQEQYQLFEWTGKYFAEVASVPGGLADWIGRCLTQFCYYAPAGAAILAVLLCGVQLLTWAACRRRTLPAYAASFLPVAALLAFHCDENALFGGTVALMGVLAAAALCRRVEPDRARRFLAAALIPLLYLACGGLVVVFAGIIIAAEAARGARKAWSLGVALLLALVASILLAQQVFPYPLGRLCYGVHYHRYRNFFPTWLWAAGLLSFGLAILPPRERPERRQLAFGASLFALAAIAGVSLTLRFEDKVKEEWMRYDFMVRMEMWNRIMMLSDTKNPDNPATVSCLNLALSKTGRMGDHMFDYFQNGPEGLLPSSVRNHTNPVPTGEIYWHLGMVNTAQRFAFEAQEAIPDFQKSARLYKRLVQTNIVNGDLAVARKYLRSLEHTLFYHRWAKETAAEMDAGDVFERQPELARARDLRLKEHDFLFSAEETDSMLGLLKVENPANGMALEYLMAWCLLRKDLDRFVEVLPMVDTPSLPKSWQEALLLRWVLTHNDFNGLPDYISRTYVQRIASFISDSRSGKSEADMQRSYGDTYWFYYYYRYRQ